MVLLWTIIFGGIIGSIAAFIIRKNSSGINWFADIIAGIIGACIGQGAFGAWGPQLAGLVVIPAILGSIILVLVVTFLIEKAL